MRGQWIAMVLATMILSAGRPADAGPIRDLFEKRAEQRRGAPGADGNDESSLEGRGEGASSGKAVLPSGGRVERDISYGPDAQNKLDVYIPANAKAAPVLVMVHGGAWMVGDKAAASVANNKVARWLPKGYILVSVNYRMSHSPNPVQQADDVGTALAYAQTHAASWGGNPERVLLMGHSSGAHLVSLVAADPQIALGKGARPWLGTVALDSAAMDVVRTMEKKHYGFYDRVFGKDKAFWAEASPYQRLNTKPAPMLLVCSSQRDDSCPAARAFAEKVQSLGGRATVLPVDLKHGEVNSVLGSAGTYTAGVESFMQSLGLP